MTISQEIAKKAGTKPAIALKVMVAMEEHINEKRRQPAPPPPEGGISIRAAGRKYNVDFRTISTWVKRGLVKVILETKNNKYIDEKSTKYLCTKYNSDPGRGKRTIFKN